MEEWQSGLMQRLAKPWLARARRFESCLLRFIIRWDGRAVECAALEKQCDRKITVSSNLTPTARFNWCKST